MRACTILGRLQSAPFVTVLAGVGAFGLLLWLASYLLHALALGEGGDTVTLATSQREVAKVLGTTPETLSRSLRSLQEEGLLAVEGRTLHRLGEL